MQYLILTAAWIGFCTLHSVLATESCKVFLASKMRGNYRYYRLFYSVVSFVTLGAILFYQFSIDDGRFSESAFLKYVLALPCLIVALILMGLSIKKYFYRLSGVEVLFGQAGRPVLEISGIHRIVRHPLYIGTLMMIWSALAFFPTIANLLACILITVYTRIGISFEERKLLKVFGRAYADYKTTTPMLIPSWQSLGIRLGAISR